MDNNTSLDVWRALATRAGNEALARDSRQL